MTFCFSCFKYLLISIPYGGHSYILFSGRDRIEKIIENAILKVFSNFCYMCLACSMQATGI